MKLLCKIVNNDELYSHKDSISKLINYTIKTGTPYTAGINCSPIPDVAIQQFENIVDFYSKHPARYIRHYIISPELPLNPELMLQLAYIVASKYISSHQVFIAVHTNTEHIHAHLIMNCVNAYNGNIFSYSSKEHIDFINHAEAFGIQLDFKTTII